MPYQCRVFGNPIKQSKSPIIHQAFAEQFDIDLNYQAYLASVDRFEQEVMHFFSQAEAIGANITLPFKERAFRIATRLSDHAKVSGAVNTLIKKGNEIIGDNTDGKGLIWDLKQQGVSLSNQKVLMIGAGGAAKGVVPALLDSGLKLLHLWNRTPQKVSEIIDAQDKAKTAELGYYTENQDYDLIINATSLSLSGEIPPISESIYKNGPVCYDMVYADTETAFLRFARKQGASLCIDGLGMLVGQAAESFFLWFGQRPELMPVMSSLRRV